MAILAFALGALFSAPLWLVSRHFAPRFENCERVAMNWSLDGRPDYYASPRMALTLSPVIGTVALLLLAGGIAFATPLEDRIAALAVIPFAGLVFLGIHATHMHFAARAAAAAASRDS
ncbi:MAG: hypothetical protein J0I69_06590 [Altererythrobacter sp.]|nr:hypothetical protein [Altererythrobacter sp.]OJU59666.1 MAG: hypothetical protein BGO08_01530 [Altererythrobacter sp. 66-12]